MKTISNILNSTNGAGWQPMPLLPVPKHSQQVDVLTQLGRHYCKGFTLDADNTAVFKAVLLYFANRSNEYDRRKGLYIWGKVGTGKTLLMRMMKLFCENFSRQNNFALKACDVIALDYAKDGNAILRTAANWRGSFCYDDLGNEPAESSYYGNTLPVMPVVIASRYRTFIENGRRTHFTSNFDLDWVAANYGKREASRIKEMCNVINIQGKDRRV